MQKQHNEIEFLIFTAPDFRRVVKIRMQDSYKILGGYHRIGDPKFMSHLSSIRPLEKALEVYNYYSRTKLKEFKDDKDAQVKLWNLFYKKAIEPEDIDMLPKYRTKVDIPKPNNFCKEVSARDPYDTSQKLTRTDKMPLSSKNKERMKQYENIKTIQDVLDKGVLNINDIKYDIKLGYVKKG